MSDIHGILNMYKPPGITSFQVVAKVRRLTGTKRVGHAGTLDQQACGVLPIALGQANRVIEYLHGESKVYRAQIELGLTTDTYDSVGQIVSKSDVSSVTLERLRATLENFKGLIWQVPPSYSAIRYQGRRLHELTRAGIQVPIAPRQVNIYRLELLGWDSPFFELEIECSKGTYIRSLTQDIGQALGCGAYMKALSRERYGPFFRGGSVSLDELELSCRDGAWVDLLYPLDEVLLSWQAVILGEGKEKAVRQGQQVGWGYPNTSANKCRAYNVNGYFVGVLKNEIGDSRWIPEKIFNLTLSL